MKEITIKTIGWTIFGIFSVVTWFLMFMVLSISNSDIKTEHIITLISDNETKEIFKSIEEITTKENEMYCKNELLNLTLFYEEALHKQKQYYQVYCWRDGDYDMRCLE